MPGSTTLDQLDEPGWILATAARRRRVVAGLSAIAFAVALWNAPIPVFRAAYQDAMSTPYELVRLDQGWSYFSPEVGLVAPEVWVEIERTDGSIDRWDFPDDFPLFGTFRRYRWLKFDEDVAFGAPEFEPLLDYVERNARDSATITRLDLIIAITAPTVGSHGPYEPDYTTETVATRVVVR